MKNFRPSVSASFFISWKNTFGGSGFDTGSGDYKYTATYTYNASAGSAQGSTSSTYINCSGMYSGTASGSSVFGQATFTRPIDSASFPSVKS